MRPLKIKGSGLLSIVHLYRWNASEAIITLRMASYGVYCCGRGCDITGGKSNRLLKQKHPSKLYHFGLQFKSITEISLMTYTHKNAVNQS